MTFFTPVEELLEWRSPHGPIRYANFAEHPDLVLKDNYTAMGCIVVVTNNGNFGTLTHLDNTINIEKFVLCLNKVLDINKQNSETFLIGGNNKNESRSFLHNLRKTLQANQYNITAEHTGGSPFLKRHSTLSKSKVTVETSKSGKAEITELCFQQIENNDLLLNNR